MNSEKLYLMILDGFGEGKNYDGNAIEKANMPNYRQLLADNPHTTLEASGNAVGLPEGVMGNSEVGHVTMGAGRIIFQSLETINQSIKDGSFFRNQNLLQQVDQIKNNKGTIHLLGMISDAGVHSHIDHLFALLKLAKQHDLSKIFIHCIADGRDVEERSILPYLEQIQQKIQQLGLENKAQMATIVGRYYAMDRDENWDRTQKAFELLTEAKGSPATNYEEAINQAYNNGAESDYYIAPIALTTEGTIKDDDLLIFFNFRTDRPRQLTACFTNDQKVGFQRNKKPKADIIVFGDYSKNGLVLYPAPIANNNLAQVLSDNHIKQLRLAETEKYAHVTYFFNSQIEEPTHNEERIVIDSPKVAAFDEKPEMSAKEVTEEAIKQLTTRQYDIIIQNFANPDLVGHSGNLDATVKALETVDECIGHISRACEDNQYTLIITADHGNAEYMTYEETGDPCPSHTTNKVPCVIVAKSFKNGILRANGGLADIAPTILDILDIPKPPEMTGQSLLQSE